MRNYEYGEGLPILDLIGPGKLKRYLVHGTTEVGIIVPAIEPATLETVGDTIPSPDAYLTSLTIDPPVPSESPDEFRLVEDTTIFEPGKLWYPNQEV